MTRTAALRAAVFGLGVAALAATAAAFLPEIVGLAAFARLRAAGIAPVALHVDKVGLNHAKISDIALGQKDLTIRTVQLDYSLAGLLHGRLERLAVDGAALRAELNGGGLSFGQLDRLRGGDGGGQGSGLDVAMLSLTGSRLILNGAPIPVAVTKNGDAVEASADMTAALADSLLANGVDEADSKDATTLRLTGDAARRRLVIGGPNISFDVTATRQEDGGYVLTSDKGLALGARRLPEAWLTDLPPGMRASLSRPVTIGVTGRDQAFLFGVKVTDGGYHAGGALRLAILGQGLEGHAEIGGAMDIRDDFVPRHFDLDTLAFAASWHVAEGAMTAALHVGPLHGAPPVAEGPARLHLAAQNLKTAMITAQKAGLATDGLLRFDGLHMAYGLERGSLTLEGAALPGLLRLTAPATLPLLAQDRPLLDLTFDEAGAATLRHHLAAGPLTLAGQLALSDPPLPATARAPRLDFDGEWALPDGAYKPDFRLAGGSVTFPGQETMVDDIAATYDGDARLKAGKLHHGGKTPWFTPLTLDMSLHPQASGYGFSGRLADGAGLLDIQGGGSLDLDSESGKARLKVKPLTFARNGLQPGRLFPALGERLRDVTGTLALAGDIGWRKGKVTSNLDLLVRDFSGDWGSLGIRRLNSVVTLTGLSPLTTPPRQTAAVAAIQAGLPLRDGLLSFSLDRGRLHLGYGELELAGGRVIVSDTVLDPVGKPRLILLLSGVDLARLADLAHLDGLSATGRLDGMIPLRFEGGAIAVENGRLAATQPGLLRYRPAKPPAALQEGGMPAELMLKALDNFHYKDLTLVLNGRTGEETVAALHVAGANPDLYDGYPLEFNLNVSGKLDTILDDALTGYRIPDRIRDRMTRFGETQ